MVRRIYNDEALLEKVTTNAFKSIDKDGSGFISKEELGIFMNKIANDNDLEEPTNEDIEDVYKSLDKDNKGKLSFEDFRPLVLRILEICD